MKTVQIQYFAILREAAGKDEETLSTAATTPADLYLELQARYAFTFPLDALRVSINARFAKMHDPLQSDDRISFIPPVAGG